MNITENKPIIRTISNRLTIGILFMPYIFAWLTLRKGYSKGTRKWSFSWLIGFVLVFILSNRKNEVKPVAQATVAIATAPAPIAVAVATPKPKPKPTPTPTPLPPPPPPPPPLYVADRSKPAKRPKCDEFEGARLVGPEEIAKHANEPPEPPASFARQKCSADWNYFNETDPGEIKKRAKSKEARLVQKDLEEGIKYAPYVCWNYLNRKNKEATKGLDEFSEWPVRRLDQGQFIVTVTVLGKPLGACAILRTNDGWLPLTFEIL